MGAVTIGCGWLLFLLLLFCWLMVLPVDGGKWMDANMKSIKTAYGYTLYCYECIDNNGSFDPFFLLKVTIVEILYIT